LEALALKQEWNEMAETRQQVNLSKSLLAKSLSLKQGPSLNQPLMHHDGNFMLFILLQIVVFFFGIPIPSLVFIGIGFFFSKLFHLSLFEASLLCIGSAFVFSFYLFLTKERLFKRVFLESQQDEVDPDSKIEYHSKKSRKYKA
jgi:hypothetical protein